MKLLCTLTICVLTLQVESQSFQSDVFDSGQYSTDKSRIIYPEGRQSDVSESNQFAAIRKSNNNEKETEHDSYLQAISRNQNTVSQQLSNFDTGSAFNDYVVFKEPSSDLSPPPFGSDSSPDYYLAQQGGIDVPPSTSEASNIPLPTDSNIGQKEQQNQGDYSKLDNVTLGLSSFGLKLMKVASQSQPGNVIISPTSIATILALVQQGATGKSQQQITKSLQLTPEASQQAFGTITATIQKRNSRNVLNIANNVVVADTFDLNPSFKSMAIRNFWSEVTPAKFNDPADVIKKINAWVASKTNDKITNLLPAGSLTQNTQLVLTNAVYFKGIWDVKFNPRRTRPSEFFLSNGDKKTVSFMHIHNSYQIGLDPSTRALVTILPFEGRQYSLMLILPDKHDNAASLLDQLTVEQLHYYKTFDTIEINLEIPKFVLKTDTDLSNVLKNIGITSIFDSTSDLSGIGLYKMFSPQISNAVHSGYLSIDEQGVTATAASALVAVALSLDDSTMTFRADRPFIAVLWDNEFSIPLFIAKIEDPS